LLFIAFYNQQKKIKKKTCNQWTNITIGSNGYCLLAPIQSQPANTWPKKNSQASFCPHAHFKTQPLLHIVVQNNPFLIVQWKKKIHTRQNAPIVSHTFMPCVSYPVSHLPCVSHGSDCYNGGDISDFICRRVLVILFEELKILVVLSVGRIYYIILYPYLLSFGLFNK